MADEVWVLSVDVDYNDWMVMGVFSSAERAMDSVKDEAPEGWARSRGRGPWYKISNGRASSDMRIERYVLDERQKG